MESINNMASTAAKTVWRTNGSAETKKEPISGVNGDISKGEPYDAGNMDATKQAKVADSADLAPGDTTHAQNDTRSPSNPTTDIDPGKQEVQMADGGADLNAPGPKPLSDVAKEHGGDAGNVGSGGSSSDIKPSRSSISSSSSSSDEGEKGPKEGPTSRTRKKRHDKGTGEEYVKSSGLNADGGDFDASAPGAGREADRLLDKKGMKHPIEKMSSPPSESTGKPTHAHGEEPSLKEKIMAKLHAH